LIDYFWIRATAEEKFIRKQLFSLLSLPNCFNIVYFTFIPFIWFIYLNFIIFGAYCIKLFNFPSTRNDTHKNKLCIFFLSKDVILISPYFLYFFIPISTHYKLWKFKILMIKWVKTKKDHKIKKNNWVIKCTIFFLNLRIPYFLV